MSERKDLVLNKDTVIDGDLVCGDIRCEEGPWSLTVRGNIDAGDIVVCDLNAFNIIALDISANYLRALNINAEDISARYLGAVDIKSGNIFAQIIDAFDIDAGNIDADVIICNSRIKRVLKHKTYSGQMLTGRSFWKRKEQMPDDTTKQVERK